MSDTPRTDAVCEKNFHDNGPKSDAPETWLCRESVAGEISDVSRTLERELNEAKTRIEVLEADAARYQWIKAQQRLAYGDTAVVNWNIGHDWMRINSESLDAAIDAARTALEKS